MPTASFSVEIFIKAPLQAVFAYVSDLTRHAEWADNPLEIVPLSPGPAAQGSRYRSSANSHGVTFQSELVVRQFEPPERFIFGGEDATGQFSHEFTFVPSGGGTLLKRRIIEKLLGLKPSILTVSARCHIINYSLDYLYCDCSIDKNPK